MKAQGNLMVKEDNSRSGSKDMFSEDAEGYMFYLDFYHDNYCISESAIFKFELSETIYHAVDNLFKEFVHEKDLPYVLQSIVQVRNGFIRKNFKCRCYGKGNEVLWVNCHLELIKNDLKGLGIVVGCIREIKQEHLKSIDSLQSDVKFISDYCSATNSSLHSDGYVMKLGIDNIKEINEKYGLHMADNIMQTTLDCIMRFIDSEVKLYKTGSDKFIIFDAKGGSIKKAEKLYRNIKEEVNKYNEHMQIPVYYTVSAGVAEFDSYGDDYIEQCKKVDFAFNTYIRRGKNCIFLF